MLECVNQHGLACLVEPQGALFIVLSLACIALGFYFARRDHQRALHRFRQALRIALPATGCGLVIGLALFSPHMLKGIEENVVLSAVWVAAVIAFLAGLTLTLAALWWRLGVALSRLTAWSP